jgi:xylulokinase
MAEHLLIGIDLGTTNGKVVCYDSQGISQVSVKHTYETHYPRPGWYEQDPNDWLIALEQGLKDVTDQLGSRVANVAGIAVSNFGPGLVMVDNEGRSLAPCPTWQDERCRTQGQRLLDSVGSDWIGLGAPLTGFPAKALWAIEEQPGLVARADQLLDIKGFLMRWLTGTAATDPSSGPGALGWHAQAFDFIGWPVERLSRVVGATVSPGGLRADVAHRVGLTVGTPVYTSINDGAAATLGSGVVQLSDSVITLATNGVARLVVRDRLDPNIIISRFLFSWPYVDGLWMCGGFTMSGAGSLQWLADQFGMPRDPGAYDALLAGAADVPPGSRGIVFLPYLAGRGTPVADPRLRGGFVHVGLEHGRPELTMAVLEGVAFALSEIYAEFSRLGFDVGPIRLTGGGARSTLWRQIIANVLDRPVQFAGGDATLGNAMVAAVGLGLYTNFAEAAETMVSVHAEEEPQPADVAAYERAYEHFAQTRDALLSAPRPLVKT